jgi:hypothetical protein
MTSGQVGGGVLSPELEAIATARTIACVRRLLRI